MILHGSNQGGKAWRSPIVATTLSIDQSSHSLLFTTGFFREFWKTEIRTRWRYHTQFVELLLYGHGGTTLVPDDHQTLNDEGF